MHGIVFSELKKYVVAKLGGPAWNTLLEKSNLAGKTYLPNQAYPDAEALQLVGTASQVTGTPVPKLLEDFGEFIAPDLMQMYRSQIGPTWKTLDLLQNTEDIIHRAVRLKIPDAKPPQLRSRRPTPERVVIEYTSARRMCGLARGIIRGVSQHYKESVDINDDKCMLKGDPRCEISVTLKK